MSYEWECGLICSSMMLIEFFLLDGVSGDIRKGHFKVVTFNFKCE